MSYWEFTSSNNWFSTKLPKNWSEYEDEEGTYAFFNTDEWSGNLRITPYRWPDDSDKAPEYIKDELNDNPNAVAIKIGDWDAAFYSKEAKDDCLIYFWAMGIRNHLFLCSFTVDKNMVGTEKHDKELNIVENVLNNIGIN